MIAPVFGLGVLDLTRPRIFVLSTGLAMRHTVAVLTAALIAALSALAALLLLARSAGDGAVAPRPFAQAVATDTCRHCALQRLFPVGIVWAARGLMVGAPDARQRTVCVGRGRGRPRALARGRARPAFNRRQHTTLAISHRPGVVPETALAERRRARRPPVRTAVELVENPVASRPAWRERPPGWTDSRGGGGAHRAPARGDPSQREHGGGV